MALPSNILFAWFYTKDETKCKYALRSYFIVKFVIEKLLSSSLYIIEQKNAICWERLWSLFPKQSLANGTFYVAKAFLATVKICDGFVGVCNLNCLKLKTFGSLLILPEFRPHPIFNCAQPTLLRSHSHLTKR